MEQMLEQQAETVGSWNTVANIQTFRAHTEIAQRR